MKYIAEFREPHAAKALSEAIKQKASPSRYYRLMEFCGGHTHTIHRYGLPDLLPENIEMIHGPGCPVCVLPIGRVDEAIALSSLPDVIFCSYGDMLRVPGTNQQNLMRAKARGADVRMVYAVDDALDIARKNPQKEVIFFAIGFETTTPPTACAIQSAYAEHLTNFSVFCNHVLTPVAMNSLLQGKMHEASAVNLDGFVGPAHVSILIGSNAYQAVANQYQKPIVIAGFEPLDVLHAILMLVEQINQGRHEVEIQYTRAVTAAGNLYAQQLVDKIFEPRESFAWRGLGDIPFSALKIRPEYQLYDAEKKFSIDKKEGTEHKQCDCGAILRGIKKPTDCKLFAKACTPENPLGACMVSSEGACAAMYAYARRA
ncbi:hydrogenase formation protein HypD [Legionella londiniensis]|uniref:Hydrogenase maturation factor n=1 Tax=Legionella londiniensis TaxID=45068 RepID=A0A0W0VSZ2_9GAMM|nr:hydrogenase formation protein HypD [Legionella londiniensis]KTD23228.1 hydrogenase expression/formation protein HypD [Legionella londiniensis]STX93761.1 hydrogenase expression/formation protein HypD [Legionella londiniensis]